MKVEFFGFSGHVVLREEIGPFVNCDYFVGSWIANKLIIPDVLPLNWAFDHYWIAKQT